MTADQGDDSMLIVWDSITATPVRTFFNPHEGGVKCLDLSSDNMYIATLGNDNPQTISLWDWTNEKEDGPICSLRFKYIPHFQGQHWVKFNPDDPTELATNGTQRVVFLNWDKNDSELGYYAPTFLKRDFSDPKNFDGALTKTVFIPNT